MFIKQRQVRRSSKFGSKWDRSTRRRGDYVASIYAMAVVQLVLCVVLLVGAYRSIGLVHDQFPNLEWYFRLGIPVGVLVIALVFLKAAIGNVRHAVDVFRIRRTPSDSR